MQINKLKNIFFPDSEYVPTVITDPMATVNQWADASTSFLLGIHGDVLGFNIFQFAFACLYHHYNPT